MWAFGASIHALRFQSRTHLQLVTTQSHFQTAPTYCSHQIPNQPLGNVANSQKIIAKKSSMTLQIPARLSVSDASKQIVAFMYMLKSNGSQRKTYRLE